MDFEQGAYYRAFVDRLERQWPSFIRRREEMLAQHRRYDHAAAEKVAENILSDLFTEVLDWTRAGLNYQVGYADILLTDRHQRRLIVEVKRPDSLVWNRRAVEVALDQAIRYADGQAVKRVAVSDGRMFYAADLVPGGLRDRLFVALDDEGAPHDLCWISRQGILHEPTTPAGATVRDLLPQTADGDGEEASGELAPAAPLLHPKHGLPARCFAYIERASDPDTWKLPYLLADGRVDAKRLPGAINYMVANYRGRTAREDIPREAVAEILQRLGAAARRLGKMPPEAARPARTYQLLADELEGMERRGEL